MDNLDTITLPTEEDLENAIHLEDMTKEELINFIVQMLSSLKKHD